MPNNTYVALDTRTISSATSSVVFDPIPQTYTDLVLIVRGVPSTNTAGQRIRINGSTSSIYSTTLMNGDTGARSARQTNNNAFDGMNYQQALSAHYNSITHFFDYTNNATNKSTLTRYNGATTETSTSVNLWRNTAPITAIEILTVNGNFASGSVVSLYGIRAEGVNPAPKATGGVISSDSTYYYHTFPATGVFTPSQSLTCDYFVVAGAGGAGATVGGGWAGGGGGAGGYRTFTGVSFASGTAYTATVGAGGAGGSGSGGFGTKGSNTTLIGGAISTATTGGGGGGTSKENGNTQTDGRAGGSGGGAPQNTIAANGGAGNEGGYTPVEGYAGYSYVSGDLGAGQGGGAGGVRTRAIYLQEIPFNGVTAFDGNRYASGGAARWLTADGMNGAPNTGNGGFSKNDGTGTNYTGGTGGSGIVVIRYLKA